MIPLFAKTCKHLQNRDKATVREAETSARWFSPARQTSLFLDSLSSSRNHARSSPDGFLFNFPDWLKINTVLEMIPADIYDRDGQPEKENKKIPYLSSILLVRNPEEEI
jgi:hypothetical protein